VSLRPWAGSLPSLAADEILAGLEIFIALNAVGGAVYGLGGAPSVPREWLAGSPFTSYRIPSLVLVIAVGGSMLLAAALRLAEVSIAPAVSLAAGVVFVAWILTQVAMIGYRMWLQPATFVAGLTVIALTACIWVLQ
jgi:hypothetical protein